MKITMVNTLRLGVFALTAGIISISSVGSASVMLPPGSGPTVLVGSTAAAEADLGGVVLYDKLLPFTITGPGGAVLFTGNLQNRVVQSSRTGALHFYYRIRDTKRGLNGVVEELRTHGFQKIQPLMADWRPDGLGTVRPHTAERSPGAGAIVTFNFDATGSMALVSGQESKFFYLKTTAKRYAVRGNTLIRLSSGQMVNLQTAMPIE